MTDPARAGFDQRLMKLEESQGFAEHTLEQLSAEMAQINRRLAEAITRVERLERRLDALLTTDTDNPPETISPH